MSVGLIDARRRLERAASRQDYSHSPWYFGEKSVDDADRHLQNVHAKPGSFVVVKNGCIFTASYVVQNGDFRVVKHLRFTQSSKGFLQEGDVTQHANLSNLITINRKRLQHYVDVRVPLALSLSENLISRPRTAPTTGTATPLATLSSSQHFPARSSSELFVWGTGGTLGDGRGDPHVVLELRRVQLSQVVAVAAGSTVAVASGGTAKRVFAWGTCAGLGSAPSVVPNIQNVSAVACGDSHVLMLTAGNVFAWLSGTYGQLGTGRFCDESHVIQLKQLRNVTAIAAGGNMSGCIMSDHAYVWGAIGGSEQLNVPTRVDAVKRACAISMGLFHVVVLTELGDVFTFGLNDSGQLGAADVISRSHTEPVQVHCERIRAVSAGGRSTALIGADTWSLFTFGANDREQLGRDAGEWTWKAEPVEGVQVKQISCGANHLLAITLNDMVLSYGGDVAIPKSDSMTRSASASAPTSPRGVLSRLSTAGSSPVRSFPSAFTVNSAPYSPRSTPRPETALAQSFRTSALLSRSGPTGAADHGSTMRSTYRTQMVERMLRETKPRAQIPSLQPLAEETDVPMALLPARIALPSRRIPRVVCAGNGPSFVICERPPEEWAVEKTE
eukprot:TRINITY_DN15796_c0_g1_i1.p1 TRINITY_DN15796_c0_g1~~TRINITY_DN15796_c0_g1_i1.p1  ORF type:complete len:614 (-),score=100.96 TRINITY_DN15796_c0_g1_i1:199-2040(-)